MLWNNEANFDPRTVRHWAGDVMIISAIGLHQILYSGQEYYL